MSDAKALLQTVIDLIISASDPTNFSWKNTDLQTAFQWTRILKVHFETNSESTIQALEVRPNLFPPRPVPIPSTPPLPPPPPPSLLSQAITPQIPLSQQHYYLNPATTSTQFLSNPDSILLQNLIFRPNPPSGWLQHVISAYVASAILPLSSSSPSPSQHEAELTLCRTIGKLISNNTWKNLASSCMEEKEKEKEDTLSSSSSSSYFSTPRTLRLAAVAKLILNHLETESPEQFQDEDIEEPRSNTKPRSSSSISSSVSDIISLKCPMLKRDVEILCLMVLISDWNNITAMNNNSREKCTTTHSNTTSTSIIMSKDVLKDINQALGNAVHLAPDTVFSLPLQLLAEVCLRSYGFTSSLVSEALKQQSTTATAGGGGDMNGGDQLNSSNRVVIMHGIADMLEHSSSTRTFIKHGIAADIK